MQCSTGLPPPPPLPPTTLVNCVVDDPFLPFPEKRGKEREIPEEENPAYIIPLFYVREIGMSRILLFPYSPLLIVPIIEI